MSHAPAEIIRDKCSSVVESYNFTRTKNCNWASSLTKLAHATAQEYEDRFLIELIQNGYDVHDSQQLDGTIWIHFARDEGDFGTLYVANGGRPFTESNFHAICEIAQSDKEPGAGIGNKGVGFKSVLQVCKSPEIYSVDADSQNPPHFDGFCFRFAHSEDYSSLCNGDDLLLVSMRRDVSPYFLPVHIPCVPETVARFATLGMVTVVRMPLSGKSGRNVVTQQLEKLRASPVPILLFLPRIGRLVVEESVKNEIVTRTEIRRQQEPITVVDSTLPVNWSTVTIRKSESDERGEHQSEPRRFFVARKVVDQHRLRVAIDLSIEQGHLDERFSKWTEEAEVSAAVEIGGDTPLDCRLYTFLPMGQEARCPFGGHLNAPFAPNMARTHVNAAVPLNSLFFDVAAELTADAVLALSEVQSTVLDSVLVDLLTWQPPHVPRLSAAFKAIGKAVAEHPLLKLVASESLPSRGSIAETYAWNVDYRVFKALEIRRITKAPILAAVAGTNRNARLTAFVLSLGYRLDPVDATLAQWSEDVAKDLVAQPFAVARWNDYYADIAALFTHRGDSLVGRRILLDSSSTLRQAGPFRGTATSTDRPVVFFPPTTERSEDDEELGTTAGVAIPSVLSQHMCYLHEELSWYERDGAIQRRSAAREFLQKAQLVQRFDTRNLIEHCSRISQNTKSSNVRESSLRLAFSLQRAARSRDALGLERLPFFVPTHDGWRLATDSLFSQRWPGSRGTQLVTLIASARTVSADIASLEKRLIASPTDEPFKDGAVGEWKEFLSRIGVKDGLWPLEMPLSTMTYRGDDLTTSWLGHLLKMTHEAVAQWERMHTHSQVPNHPWTDYRVQTPFYRLPGQFEFEQLTDQAKHTYARLVFAQIGSWGSEHFDVTIERPRPTGKDTLSWPTPLAAFLRHAPWVPVREDAATERFVIASDAWHFNDSDGSVAPGFLPILPRDLRWQLDEGGLAYERLVERGRLRVVGRLDDAPSLVALLGELLVEDQVDEAEWGAFRRLYNQAWQQMLGMETPPRAAFTNSAELYLAINRGAALVPVKVREGGRACHKDELFVVDSGDQLRRQLLSDLRIPTLDVGARVGSQVVALLRDILGNSVRASSSVNIEVLVDGNNVLPGSTLPLLFDESTAWVKHLLALVIQLKGRVPSHHSTQAQLQVQKRLTALRTVKGGHVSLRVDNANADLPQFFHDVVLINDAEWPTIAFRGDAESWTWDTLERLVPSMVTAVERGSIQAEMEVAIHRLARVAVDVFAREPGEQELADALSTSVDEVRSLRREWHSQKFVLLEYLFPLVYHLASAAVATPFDPSGSSFTSKDEIRQALLSHQPAIPLAVDDLLEKCATSPSLWALRDELGIDYAAFNVTLCAIGSPYKPAKNEEGHRSEFAFFKQTQGEAILGRLRARFVAEFREGKSLQRYTEIRELTTLQPDPLWLDICDLPSDVMMRGRANAWLHNHGALSLDELPPELASLPTIRAENRKAIRSVSEELMKLVPIWCSKNGVVMPIVWAQANVADSINDTMFGLGMTDFERLPVARILEWLAANSYLPSGMPHSMEHATLGVTAEDLIRGESDVEKQKREREYERRTIEIDGGRFSSAAGECDTLIEKVRSSILPGFLASPASLSRLGLVSSTKKAKGKHVGGGGGPGPDGRMTDAQKHAAGLVGELLAFEWLKAHYEGVCDECWKSKYRNLVFGGVSGDDSLGFDFEVFLKKKSSYFFEVKATTGSNGVIELGATELETSQRLARTNRYRILFIPNVLDASQRKVFVLPNPFSKRGRGLFQATGTGIRFRFLAE